MSVQEDAALIALQQGLALVEENNTIYGLKTDGVNEFIAKGKTRDEAWSAALKALKDRSVDNSDQTISSVEIIVYTDGGSRGNPGPSASGFVIVKPTGEVIEEGGEYLGITTNNQAEYRAVQLALAAALRLSPQHLELRLDSELVARQLTGQYKIKNIELKPIHEAIQKLLSQFPKVTIKHVRREFNRLADAQVNQILDSQRRVDGIVK